MNSKQAMTILILMIGLLYSHFLVYKYNTKVDKLKVSFPEEMPLIKAGDILVCERVGDSIYLGFANHATNPMEAEYIVNLVDNNKSTVYSVDDDTTYICTPSTIQQAIDANEE